MSRDCFLDILLASLLKIFHNFIGIGPNKESRFLKGCRVMVIDHSVDVMLTICSETDEGIDKC